MTDEICEVVITAPDEEWLVRFTHRLITDRLAAAGHHTRIRTVYTWRGQTEETYETRAALRTRLSLFETILDKVAAEHPYVVPSVTATPIIAANPDYQAWVLESTRCPAVPTESD